MIRSRLVKPRASLMALIAASVPEEDERTISTDGTASTSSAANSTSASVRSAEGRPAPSSLGDRSERLLVGVTEDERPPAHHPVEIAVPVDVLDRRAAAAADEDGLVETDRSHCPDR
jgi:hypothetical protein